MILITGCAGFIGFHLSKKLVADNQKVLGIDSIDAYYSKNKKYQRLKILKKYKNFKFIKIDLINFEKLSNILEKKQKINKIIHLAAQPGVRVSISKPHNTMKKNLTVFLNIIELARIKKVKKFIYASSSSVYGDSKI